MEVLQGNETVASGDLQPSASPRRGDGLLHFELSTGEHVTLSAEDMNVIIHTVQNG